MWTFTVQHQPCKGSEGFIRSPEQKAQYLIVTFVEI